MSVRLRQGISLSTSLHLCLHPSSPLPPLPWRPRPRASWPSRRVGAPSHVGDYLSNPPYSQERSFCSSSCWPRPYMGRLSFPSPPRLQVSPVLQTRRALDSKQREEYRSGGIFVRRPWWIRLLSCRGARQPQPSGLRCHLDAPDASRGSWPMSVLSQGEAQSRGGAQRAQETFTNRGPRP